MAITDITTAFNTNTHSVIGSRYELALFENEDQLLQNFRDDIELQFKNYGIELFTVAIAGDEPDAKVFSGEIDPEDIIDYVSSKIK